MTMDFHILGPLEVIDDGHALALGAAKQRAVLAVLLLHPNQVVAVSRLVDELWGEAPPTTAAKVVQGYVSRLRKILSADTIVTSGSGYLVRVEPDRLDAHRFERLVLEGRTFLLNDPVRAVQRFQRALALWRGLPFEGLDLLSLARSETLRLVEEQLTAIEQRIEAELVLSRHADLIQLIPGLIAQNPYRERLRAHLMLALYRSGRQAEALTVYRDTRQVLISELGIEPSRELQLLQERILSHDPNLDAPRPSEVAPPAAIAPQPVGPARRLVTVVVVVGLVRGAEIDPESRYRIMEGYSARCRDTIQRHGGSVPGPGGDTTTGIFGLAELHEDDAVRAVRAADEIRAAITEANDALERDLSVRITVSIGVESGSVFVGAGIPQEQRATGDAMELAAALAHSAADNEILLGAHALHLAGRIWSADARESLSLPTRAEPVSRWRLRGLRADAPPLPVSTVFVGHRRDLRELRAALAQTLAESSCRLITLVGPAGIGKSRLTREFISDLGSDVTVVVGHCLSYGEGITYHPLAEIVSQLIDGDLEIGIRNLLSGEANAESIERQVLAAIGKSQESTQTEETFWALRRLFERVARTHPLITVIDDLHWAEPTFLDLLDHIVTFSSGSPMLLVCLTRPELIEILPSWTIPQANRSIVILDPLDDSEAYELIDALDAGGKLDRRARKRAVETAEGNPFFLEQIVAVSATGADGTLPLSVQAVLTARIDQLEPGERNLLGLAAVQGRTFHRGDLAALIDDVGRRDMNRHLAELLHRQFLRTGRPEIDGADSFRFAHVLIREAAYDAMPKQLRAQLHEAIANLLKLKENSQAEVIGFHLERSYRFCAELGLIGEREQGLATEAAEWLDSAARAALLRGDLAGGAGLLERAASLFGHDDGRRFGLLPRLGEALFEAGRLKDAERFLNDAIRYAQAANLPELAALATVERQRVLIQAGAAWSVDHASHVADTAIEILGQSGDELGQCRAWCLHATIKWILGRALDADQNWMRAAEHAERAGDNRELFEILCWRASAAAVAPTPVSEGIRQCDEIRDRVSSSPVAVAATLHPLALLQAMNGDFVQAHELVREADAILDDLGRLESTVSHHEASIELLADRPAMAESKLLAGYHKLEEMGEKSLLATTAAMLGQASFAQGHDKIADEYCSVSEQTAADDDIPAQVIWRRVRARLLAQREKLDAAEALARQAVKLAMRTDFVTAQGDALVDLGAVLDGAGRNADAETAMRKALELYVAKGNIVSARRAQSWLTSRASDLNTRTRTEDHHAY
jgi:DNA-binding SARP family transcriptional activator/predicted ATPase